MTYYVFERKSNNFNDILKDKTIKPFIQTSLVWNNHCMIQLLQKEDVEKIESYITIKFADYIKKTPLTNDYTPIDGVDYRSMVPQHLKDQRRK